MIARGQTLGVGATPRRRRGRIIYVYIMGGGGIIPHCQLGAWTISPAPLFLRSPAEKRGRAATRGIHTLE